MPTVKELRAQAKSIGVSGYSSMRKAELEKAVATPASNKGSWTIYTKDGCGYCKKAKQLLDDHNLPYKVVEVTDQNKAKVYKKIDKKTKKYRFFPVVFQGGKFIGGYTELEKVVGPVQGKGCTIM